ncbi:MAG: bifunctional adenosylcobinamide kinase/adenosylcobinamide-phosphate guanylyltransferase [Desulfonatronovibrio sp.]
MFSLILGGSKSGKSDMGLSLLEKTAGSSCLVVTGKAMDFEFNEQIREHKLSRSLNIPVVEAAEDLGSCLRYLQDSADAVLVDSIDFWVFNIFARKHPQVYIDEFFRVLDLWRGKRLIFISAEIGLGPVPAADYVRRFSRLLGEINQRLALLCNEVTLIVAGLPIRIK